MKLSERGLGKELGVSRTPMREAFQMLLSEGVIERLDDGSVQVKSFSLADMRDVYQTRMAIESSLTALAAQNAVDSQIEFLRECCRRHERLIDQMASGAIPPEDFHLCKYINMEEVERPFHNTIAQASGNRLMVKLVDQMFILSRSWTPLQTFRILSPEEAIKTNRRVLGEHEAILSAIAAHDADAARKEGWFHVENAMNIVLQCMEQKQIPDDSVQSKLNRITNLIK